MCEHALLEWRVPPLRSIRRGERAAPASIQFPKSDMEEGGGDGDNMARQCCARL